MAAKIDHKAISDTLAIEVHHKDGFYTVYATNSSRSDKIVLRLNFAGSINMAPRKGPEFKIAGPNIVELSIMPHSQVLAAHLDPVDANQKYSYSYTCATKNVPAAAKPAEAEAPSQPKASAPAAAAKKPSAPKGGNGGKPTPPPAGVDESERKELCEKLDIMINSINNGYNLLIDNMHESATFTVTLNLEECENLKLEPEGSAALQGKSVQVVVPPYTCSKCINLPVDNMDLGACELRYKASIKKS